MTGTPDYAENHRFAACFTLFAALSQGIGGALVAFLAYFSCLRDPQGFL